jgi:hypothetical protein
MRAVFNGERLVNEVAFDVGRGLQLFLCSYLGDSIGLVRTIHAHPFRPKMVGASMIGPQNTAVKTTLGPLLNGFVNYEYWEPGPQDDVPWGSEISERLSGARWRFWRRSPRALRGTASLCPDAGRRPSGRSHRQL